MSSIKEKPNSFEIKTINGVNIDENGEKTQYDGARFDSLNKSVSWIKQKLSQEKLSFPSDDYQMCGSQLRELEWFDDCACGITEYAGVGFDVWQWRYTRNGLAYWGEGDQWVLYK
jgi:hypothetical protein